MASDTLSAPKSKKVEGRGKEQMVVDIVDEDFEENTPRDEPKLVELDVIIAEESDEEGALLKAKILQIVQEEDGMKKITDIWINGPSYEQDSIEDTLGRYFIDDNIELESLQNVLPKELIECIREAMDFLSLEKKEDEIISHLNM